MCMRLSMLQYAATSSRPQSLCCDFNVLIVQRCWKHSTSGEAMAHAVIWWCGTHVATSLF